MHVKEIPFTLNFKASLDGRIFDNNDKEKNQYENLDGYKTASVLNLEGKWQTFGVHRLVALAHIPFTGDVNYLTVNHKNGNVKHNHCNNLEWVSVAQNNIHAVLLRGSKHRPVILAKNEEGAFEFISNLQTAAKKLNCDVDLIWQAIKDKKKIFGWYFSHYSNNSLKPKELHLEKMTGKRENGKLKKRGLDILNMETSKTVSFSSIHDLASHFKVTNSAVHKTISEDDNVRVFNKKYLIVDSGKQFPVVTQEIYEKALAPFGKEVVTYNIETNTYVIYKSASQFIKENKLSKKAVSLDLRNNRLRIVSGWWFTYNTLDNIEKFKKVVSLTVFRQESNKDIKG